MRHIWLLIVPFLLFSCIGEETPSDSDSTEEIQADTTNEDAVEEEINEEAMGIADWGIYNLGNTKNSVRVPNPDRV